MTVCIDASLVLKLYLPEPESPAVEALWTSWEEAGDDVWAPALIDYEVGSVFRLHAFRASLTLAEAGSRFADYRQLPIFKEHDSALVARSLEIAAQIGQPRLYDSAYLAVAERHGAPLWTADNRLWNAARGRFPWVHRLGVG